MQSVVYDVVAYKLTQLGHDVQNWSVTVVTPWTSQQRDVQWCCY